MLRGSTRDTMLQYVKGVNPATLAWKEYKLNYIWPAIAS